MKIITKPTKKSEHVELPKRFYMPGVSITCNCPKCGAEWFQDLGKDHLSYPVAGKAHKIEAYCPNEHCLHEWTAGRVVVRMTLEVA